LFYRPGNGDRSSPFPQKFDTLKHGLDEVIKDKSFVIFRTEGILCRATCPIAIHGHDYYTYGGHLSVYADRKLERPFEKILSTL
jgi:hypothetical protein